MFLRRPVSFIFIKDSLHNGFVTSQWGLSVISYIEKLCNLFFKKYYYIVLFLKYQSPQHEIYIMLIFIEEILKIFLFLE